MANIKKHLLGRAIGATTLGVGTQVSQVSADSVVYTSNNPGGKTQTTDTTGQANQNAVNQINSQIKDLAIYSNGAVTINPVQETVTDSQVPAVQSQLDHLKELTNQYVTLKAKLQTQDNSGQQLTGMTAVANNSNVTGTDINDTASKLQDLINQMQEMANRNDAILKDDAESAKNNNALDDDVRLKNMTITQAAEAAKSDKDGIVGNMDTVNRKSQDSDAQNGIHVDNTETQRQNTVTSVTENKKIQVNTIQQAQQKLAEILQDLANQDSSLAQQALDSGTYKDRALYNIDDINKWLANMRSEVEQARQRSAEEKKHNQDVIDRLTAYKNQIATYLDQMHALVESIPDSPEKQNMLNHVQDAQTKVANSDISTLQLPNLGQLDPYNFGDIGKSQYDQNGAQDGSIDSTKTMEQQKFEQNIINTFNDIVNTLNNTATNLQNTDTKNNDSVTDFKTKLEADIKHVQDFHTQMDNLMNSYKNVVYAQLDDSKRILDSLPDSQEKSDMLNEIQTARSQVDNSLIIQDASPIQGQDDNAIVGQMNNLSVTNTTRMDDFTTTLKKIIQERIDFTNKMKAVVEQYKQDAISSLEVSRNLVNQLVDSSEKTEMLNRIQTAINQVNQSSVTQAARQIGQTDQQVEDGVNQGRQARLTLLEQVKQEMQAALDAQNVNNGIIQTMQSKMNDYRTDMENKLRDVLNKVTSNVPGPSQAAMTAKVNTAIDALHQSSVIVSGTSDISTNQAHLTDMQNQIADNYNRLNDFNSKLDTAIASARTADRFNTDLINAVNQFKSDALSRLNDIKAELEKKFDSQAKTDMLAEVDDAINKVNASSVTVSGSNSGQDNNAIKDAVTNGINDNNTRMTDFLNAVKAQGDGKTTETFGNAIDQNFLNNMPIYQQNQYGYYQRFINDAVRQTVDSTKDIQNQLDMSKSVISIGGTPTIAQMSAAMYGKSSDSYGKGFGSVMFPTSNINQIADRLNIVDGATIYSDSAFFSNGGWGIYDQLTHMPGYANTNYASWPAMRDLKEQYLDIVNGQANTRTFVTDSPQLRIRIADAFVYMDAQGNVKKKPIWVTVAATAQNGANIGEWMSRNLPTASGTKPVFVYNFQINQFTGQLTCGVSYFAVQGAAIGTGGSSLGRGGGGEHSAAVYNGYGQPVNQEDACRNIGLAQAFWTQIDGGYADTEAAEYAKNMPLYVSDLDDRQQILYYPGTRATNDKLVIPDGQGTVYGVGDWSNPYGDPRQPMSYIAHNGDNTNANYQTITNIDGQSCAAFSPGRGMAWRYRVVVRSPIGVPLYQSIDTSLFAPFGIITGGDKKHTLDKIDFALNSVNATVGQTDVDLDLAIRQINETAGTTTFIPSTIKPTDVQVTTPGIEKIPVSLDQLSLHLGGVHEFQLPVDQFHGDVKQVDVNDANAKAKTDRQYQVNIKVPYLTTNNTQYATLQNMSGNWELPSYKQGQGVSQEAVSGNSFVVRRDNDVTNTTGSGSSFVVLQPANDQNTGSGNTLVVTMATQDNRTASRNSFVVTNSSQVLTTGSGNSFIVNRYDNVGTVDNQQLDKNGEATVQPPADNSHISKSTPTVTTENGRTKVEMLVYVDPSLKDATDKVLAEWKTALARSNTDLIPTVTTDEKDLKSRVALAILDSEDSDSRADSADGKSNLSEIGGYTTKKQYLMISGDSSKKFNKSGTVTARDALKNAGTVIQMNTETLSKIHSSDILDHVLAHEFGHFLRLHHDNEDSLMTSSLFNSHFDGKISQKDIDLAVANIPTLWN